MLPISQSNAANTSPPAISGNVEGAPPQDMSPAHLAAMFLNATNQSAASSLLRPIISSTSSSPPHDATLFAMQSHARQVGDAGEPQQRPSATGGAVATEPRAVRFAQTPDIRTFYANAQASPQGANPADAALPAAGTALSTQDAPGLAGATQGLDEAALLEKSAALYKREVAISEREVSLTEREAELKRNQTKLAADRSVVEATANRNLHVARGNERIAEAIVRVSQLNDEVSRRNAAITRSLARSPATTPPRDYTPPDRSGKPAR